MYWFESVQRGSVHSLSTCTGRRIQKKRYRRWKSLDVSLHCGYIYVYIEEGRVDGFGAEESSHTMELLRWSSLREKLLTTFTPIVRDELMLKVISNYIKDYRVPRGHQMSRCKLKGLWDTGTNRLPVTRNRKIKKKETGPSFI